MGEERGETMKEGEGVRKRRSRKTIRRIRKKKIRRKGLLKGNETSLNRHLICSSTTAIVPAH